MKNLLSIVGLCILFSIISCNKDESDSDLIIGQWEAISERTVDYEDNVIVFDSTYTYEADEFVLEIRSDKTCKSYEYGESDETFGWQIDGDIFELKEGINSRGAEYTLDGDDLTLDFKSEWKEEAIEYKRRYYYIFKRI